MLVALIAHDRKGALSVRKENREAHLAYIEATGVVAQAGPLLDDDEQMIGSLVILDVADMTAAQDWADNDPYARADLFENVTLTRWNRVIGG
ncbi:YciI family protein [Citreimonas sp.]|uniref:YciI family protein n=1 Tax=Citreimonas sp. TaxID=3036715 RepID=UPI0035C7AF8C